MPSTVEKLYSGALFSLITEEKGDTSPVLQETETELSAVAEIIEQNPAFSRTLNAPTLAADEKLAAIDNVFKGRVGDYTYNLLRVMTSKGRLSYLPRTARAFKSLCNERLGIAEVVVSSRYALTAEQKSRLVAKLAAVIGKEIRLKERVDTSLIGGIVVDYGTTRFDGSVKTRLETLRQTIAGTIA
ncbi:MAG: ATP synthase F1 subunit delta [Oscillospiraceae bacterium]|jgi:F-type H+-transporting ATPase subunit delta|nr:ATP synthase F1 subunit delta [Oscillospiraceae bacterium]